MNWISITIDDLKAVALGQIIAAAQGLVMPGQADPVAAAIADAVATVRSAVGVGNVLDVNPAAVPGSLRALTARTAVFALLERMEIELTTDQRTTRAADTARLGRIRDGRQRFEPADHPDGSGETPATAGIVETVAEGNRGHGRDALRGI